MAYMPLYKLDYIVAPPRMAYYIQYSTRVYEVYLKYIAPEDKLEQHGMDTMGKVARCSIENEELLYSLFGVNAELLIDHA